MRKTIACIVVTTLVFSVIGCDEFEKRPKKDKQPEPKAEAKQNAADALICGMEIKKQQAPIIAKLDDIKVQLTGIGKGVRDQGEEIKSLKVMLATLDAENRELRQAVIGLKKVIADQGKQIADQNERLKALEEKPQEKSSSAEKSAQDATPAAGTIVLTIRSPYNVACSLDVTLRQDGSASEFKCPSTNKKFRAWLGR